MQSVSSRIWIRVAESISYDDNDYTAGFYLIISLFKGYCLCYIIPWTLFTYLGVGVSSTEKDIDTWLVKAWAAIDELSIIWRSDLTDKMKRSFFQAAVVSILLYGCIT